MLTGYKTYITAAVTIIGAVAGILTGALPLVGGLQLIVPALLGVFLRNGIDAHTQSVIQNVQAAMQVVATTPVLVSGSVQPIAVTGVSNLGEAVGD